MRSTVRPWLIAIGYVLALATALFITARLNFAPFLMVDRDLALGEALSQSWSRTTEFKGAIALLLVLMMLAIFVGVLALAVGAIPGAVFGLLLWVSAYRQIFGGPRSS